MKRQDAKAAKEDGEGARRHKRSLDQEAILCLERAVSATASAPSLADPPPPVSVGAILRPFTNRGDLLDESNDP